MPGILARIVAALAAGVGLVRRGPAQKYDPLRPVCRVRREGRWSDWPDHRYGTPADEVACRELLERRRGRWKSNP